MTRFTKQKISNIVYIILGFAPLVYLITFTSFLYYTGNGFGQELNYKPQPEEQKTYLFWLDLILQLENFWIISFFLWAIMLIVTAIFFKNVTTKPFIIATGIVFILAIYIGFVSIYGRHEGWMDEYHHAVLKINRR